MMPSDVQRRRLGDLFLSWLAARGKTYAELGVRGSTISNLVHGTGDVKLSTIIRVAETLDCDVVITLRERRRT